MQLGQAARRGGADVSEVWANFGGGGLMPWSSN